MEAFQIVLPPLEIPIVTTFRHTQGRESRQVLDRRAQNRARRHF